MAKMSKKPVKKSNSAAKRPTVVAAAAAKPQAMEMGGCHCHSHSCLKKLIIFVFGAIVGAAVCCTMYCDGRPGKMFGRRFGMHQEMFVNGCIDMAKIECPEKAEKIQAKDANKDGCVSKEEFFSGKEGMNKMPKPGKM